MPEGFGKERLNAGPRTGEKMSRILECPRCHHLPETGGSGWPNRSCPNCGAPLVLASRTVEHLVRRYLQGDRPAVMGAPPPRGRGARPGGA